ncbi:MAG: DUF3106 domain-containing protein [Betaproteobacteria bacterium]
MAKTLLALIVWFCLAMPGIAAQVKSEAKKPPRPAWSELKPAQREILAPLALEWDKLDSTRRKKWVAIAERYPKMKPQEQQRLQKRMRDWAALTPEQRAAAREKYQKLKQMKPDERREVRTEWERYQRSLAQQQQRQGAPLDPTLTDPPATTAQEETATPPAVAVPLPSPDTGERELATQRAQ